MLNASRSALAALTIALVLTTGCGPTLKHDMVQVSGVVLMDGEPVSGAEVLFDSDVMPRSMGVTDSEGRFKLATRQYGEGIALGEYRVKITSTPETKFAKSGKPVTISNAIAETGLKKVEITADGEKEFTLDLSSADKPARGERPANAPER